MKLDRELQLQWLNKLAEVYPEQLDIQNEGHENAVQKNLFYLYEHGLIDAEVYNLMGASSIIHHARITHRGLDFLADDGGLTAILGTVTIKLHADTFRDMLEAKIEESDLPPAEKNRLIEHIRTLPAEALKTATTHLMKQGLEHLPDAIHWLKIWLGF